MKTYSVKIKTVHFNEAITVNYNSEKNQIVDLFTESGMFLGQFRNGKKVKGFFLDSIKIEVEI